MNAKYAGQIHSGLKSKPKRRMSRFSALEILLAAAIFAGSIQSVLITFAPGLSIASSVDDGLVLLALIVALPRFVRVRGLYIVIIGLYILLMVGAVVRSTTTPDLTVQLFRQVALPAILILIGLTLLRTEWATIARAGLIVAVVNSFYMILEVFGIRLIDPNLLASSYSNTVFLYDGLPGYYFYYDSNLEITIRAGGLFLNPPIAGLVVAMGAVIAWHSMRGWKRYLLVALQLVAVYAAFGRGGFVIAGVGILLPMAVKRFGRIVTILAPIYPAILIIERFSSAGSSASHGEGLAYGIERAIVHPIGDGFGSVGNFVKLVTRDTEASESLAGVALVAGGIIVLLILVLLIIQLIKRLFDNTDLWPAALALGCIITALVSESTGALNGTIPLWLAVGFSLGPISSSFRKDETMFFRSRKVKLK